METKEWIIVVSQIVVGKSKFPHAKVGKFKRHKPWPYRDSHKPHRILYERRFIATPDEALTKAEQVDQEMFNAYILGMGNTKHHCVSEYTVVLHNVTDDISKQMSTTTKDDESKNDDFLYEGVKCSNANLGRWGIVKGLR